MDANEKNAASLPQAEGKSSDGRMLIGNWEHVESETHNQRLGDKVAGDGHLGLDESMDITTVNEQGVQWDFTDVEMRNKAFRKIVAEKPFLLMGAHSCASLRSKSNASWSRMTQREKDDELHRARVHMQSVCRMYKLQHDEGRYFLHLEMEYYDKMHVFDQVLIAHCWERTGKAHLKARWVDIDKGTRYRSRWVAKQFKGSDSEEWFAAAPPIEALRALISHTTSGPKKRKH